MKQQQTRLQAFSSRPRLNFVESIAHGKGATTILGRVGRGFVCALVLLIAPALANPQGSWVEVALADIEPGRYGAHQNTSRERPVELDDWIAVLSNQLGVEHTARIDTTTQLPDGTLMLAARAGGGSKGRGGRGGRGGKGGKGGKDRDGKGGKDKDGKGGKGKGGKGKGGKDWGGKDWGGKSGKGHGGHDGKNRGGKGKAGKGKANKREAGKGKAGKGKANKREAGKREAGKRGKGKGNKHNGNENGNANGNENGKGNENGNENGNGINNGIGNALAASRPAERPNDDSPRESALSVPPVSTIAECDSQLPSYRDVRTTGLPTRDDVTRCYASLAIAALGRDAQIAFDALAEPLARGDRRQRQRAASAIGRISDYVNQATPILVDGLGARDLRVRKRAVAIVNDIQTYAGGVVPALEEVANDDDRQVARAAIQALGDLGAYGASALPTLAQALDRDDLGVRYYASRGVREVDAGISTTAAALRRLLPTLLDEEGMQTDRIRAIAGTLQQDRSSFRTLAVESLATIGPDGRLKEQKLQDQLVAGDRSDAVRELGDIGRFTTAAAPDLATALTVAEYPTVRGAVAAEDWADLHVAVGVPPLLGTLSDEADDVRLYSATALQQTSVELSRASTKLQDAPQDDVIVGQAMAAVDSNSADAVPALLAALKDEDTDIRPSAAETLGQLGAPASDAVPALLDALKSPQSDLRQKAALAVGRIGAATKTADPALANAMVRSLADALQDPDPTVRYQAAKALGLMEKRARPVARKLEAALAERDIALRYQAARALRKINPVAPFSGFETVTSEQVEQLLSAVKKGNRDAARLLGNIGPDAVQIVPELVALLAAAEPARQDAYARLLRTVSSEALAEVPALIEALGRGGRAANRAARRLGQMGTDANLAKGTLSEALRNSDLPPEVRFALAEASGDIGAYTTAAIKALADASKTQQTAAFALRQWADLEA